MLLAGRGACVVIADLDDRGGNTIAASIRDAGGRAGFIHTDTAIEEQVKRSVDFALSEFGGLHGAFNNAGIMSKGASLVEMRLADWQKSMDVNLTGVFLCMKHQIGHMVNHGGGAVVNTSSGAGVVGFPNLPDYVASKHGVIGLTRAAAVDFSARQKPCNGLVNFRCASEPANRMSRSTAARTTGSFHGVRQHGCLGPARKNGVDRTPRALNPPLPHASNPIHAVLARDIVREIGKSDNPGAG